MPVRVGINGFGRIGRLVVQALCDQGLLGGEVEVVGVVDVVTDADHFAYQMKYDPVHGRFRQTLATRKSNPTVEGTDVLAVGGHEVRCILAAKDPSQLPWRALGATYVIGSTGLFTAAARAKGHLTAGARKVIVSAPGEGGVIHDARSSIYDSLGTRQNNLTGRKRLFKVIAWYDNEWGYSNRVVDLLRFMAEQDGAKQEEPA